MNDIGKTLTLRGKTRHGKGRVATHGKQWVVMRDDVRWRGEPAWAVVSMNKTDRGDFNSRLILKQNDPDFIVVS